MVLAFRSIVLLLSIVAGQSGNVTIARFVETVSATHSQIYSVDFSPDGSRVVTGDFKGNLKLWAVGGDPFTWRLLKTVGNSNSTIQSVDFSPDGSRVVTGDTYGNLNMWAVGGDPSSWGFLKTVGTFSGTQIYSVNFSPDGSKVVTGDNDRNLTMWAVGGDPSTWGLLKTVGTSLYQIYSVNFSPDGSRVVTGDYNGNLNMWAVGGDPITWGLLQTVGSTDSQISSVNFSPDASRVVTGDANGNLNMWAVGGDPITWGLLQTVGTTLSQITSVNFSPDGSKVVTGDYNGNLNMWAVGGDPSSWGLLKAVGTSGSWIRSLDFSPDGSRVVTGDNNGNLNMWAGGGDPSSWGLLKTVGTILYSQVYSVNFSPDGTRVVTGDANGNLNMWAVGGDPSTWGLLKTVGTILYSQIFSVNFSPDGSKVVTGHDNGKLNLWAVGGDPSNWRLLKTVGNSNSTIQSVDFSPDGSRVVTGDENGKLNLWAVGGDPSAWGFLKTVGTADAEIFSVNFSPDGSRVVSGDFNSKLMLWAVGGDPSTWRLLKTFSTTASRIYSVNFSPDGSKVVTGDDNGNLTMWAVGGDPSTWGLLRTLGTTDSEIFSVNFSPDGSKVVTGDKAGNLNLWASTGRGFTNLSVNFPPEGFREISASASTWLASPPVDFLLVVNQYPSTLQQFTEMARCGLEPYGGGPYEVCNMTVTQPPSTYLDRSSQVGELLSHFLPAMRLNFTAADMEGLTPQDLPVSWRTIALTLSKTLQCTAHDLFRALAPRSPFLEELDISGTLVSGAIANVSLPLRKLRAANTPITNVSDDFFQNFVELLDLRNTSFLVLTDAALNTDGLVFRHGVPACSEPLPGHVVDGTLCKLCEMHYYFDGRPSSQQCLPCLSKSGVAEVQVAGAVLLGLLVVLGVVGYAFRARIKKLGRWIRGLRPQVQFLRIKGKLTIFAYQQLSQLGYLASPLPPKTETLASAANIFNFQWLNNSAFAACVFGLGYHAAWMLCLMEVAMLLIIAALVGQAVGVSRRESVIFAHSLTIMTVARKTLPLFDCDDRLVSTNLHLMANVTKSYLKVDYNIECSDPQHIVFQHLGIFVLVAYCLLIPGLQTVRLYRARSMLNPPLQGQQLARLAPQSYVDLTRDELSRLDEAEFYPTRSLDQVQVGEVAAIRARQKLLQHDERFKKEVEMVSGYVPSMWWWFSVPTLSRVLLAGIYVCPAQDQAFLGCALCMLLALAVLHFRPHLRQSDNQHDMVCQASIALAFALNSVQPATPWWLTVAIGTLICLPTFNLFYHIGQQWNPACKSRRMVDELLLQATAWEEGTELPGTGLQQTASEDGERS